MRLTATGAKSLAFLLCVTAAYYVSPYTNLFFLLLAFLVCTLALGAVSSVMSLQGVAGRVQEVRPFAAGEPTDVQIQIDVRSRRACDAEVVLWLEGQRRPVRMQHVPTLSGGRLAGRITPLDRGLYPIRKAALRTTWPFGMLRTSVAIAAPEELAVYPAPSTRQRSPMSAIASQHEAELIAQGDSRQPCGVRDFAEGDSLSQVHWRATARRGSPVVVESDAMGDRQLELQIDRRSDSEAFESVLQRATDTVLAARERKEALAVTSQDFHGRFGDGLQSFDVLLRWLAAAQPLPLDAPAPAAVSPNAIRVGGRT